MSFENFVHLFTKKLIHEPIDQIIMDGQEAKVFLPHSSYHIYATSSPNNEVPSIKLKIQSYYFTSNSVSISGVLTLETNDVYQSKLFQNQIFQPTNKDAIDIHQPEIELYKTIMNFIPCSSSITELYPQQYKIQNDQQCYIIDLCDAKYIQYIDSVSQIKCIHSESKVYYQGTSTKGLEFDLCNHHQFVFQDLHLTTTSPEHIFFKYITCPKKVRCLYESSCPYMQCPLCTGKKRIKVLPEVLTDKELMYIGKQLDQDEKNILKFVKEGKDQLVYIKCSSRENSISGKYVLYKNQWILLK